MSFLAATFLTATQAGMKAWTPTVIFDWWALTEEHGRLKRMDPQNVVSNTSEAQPEDYPMWSTWWSCMEGHL
jgi:hypothetical protein